MKGINRNLQRWINEQMRWILDNYDPHLDDDSNELDQVDDCFCVRCVAFRVLKRLGGKRKTGRDALRSRY